MNGYVSKSRGMSFPCRFQANMRERLTEIEDCQEDPSPTPGLAGKFFETQSSYEICKALPNLLLSSVIHSRHGGRTRRQTFETTEIEHEVCTVQNVCHDQT